MPSPSTRRSNLRPLMIPELAPSSSDPGSPAESDTVETPFFDHSDSHIRFAQETSLDSPHIHPYIDLRKAPNYASPSPPHLFFDGPEFSPHTPLDTPPVSPPSSYRSLQEDHLSFFSASNSEPHSAKPARSPELFRASSEPLPKPLDVRAVAHSPRFPPDHQLSPYFVHDYDLEDELGAGGYGFVMTAIHRVTGMEVAVKFILKEKVPANSWTRDQHNRKLPTEVVLLPLLNHENIVKCLEHYEDSLYYYLILELHGSPWHKAIRNRSPPPIPASSSLPSLSPSVSVDSITLSEPATPPTSASYPRQQFPRGAEERQIKPPPAYSRRPSYDLFECIEQTEHKRLSEDQARYVLGQVVDAVYYLHCHGIVHRDLKDENIVIDRHLKVKLIDFGSAVVENPNEPRPYHTLFYGTTAYASSEILQKKPYQAPPAEVWTIGVLLSFLLTGSSPFPTVKDAIAGRVVLVDWPRHMSKASVDLIMMCLVPDVRRRATIEEVRAHPWLNPRRSRRHV